jgi:hypothetical protein
MPWWLGWLGPPEYPAGRRNQDMIISIWGKMQTKNQVSAVNSDACTVLANFIARSLIISAGSVVFPGVSNIMFADWHSFFGRSN